MLSREPVRFIAIQGRARLTPKRSVSDAEQEVLSVLWDRGPATARDVLEALSSDRRNWAYTTAKTLLDRLESKGFVTRDRRGSAHVFAPSMGRDEFMRHHARTLRDELFDGQAAPFVHALLDGLDLTQQEITEIRDALDAMAKPKRRKKR